MPRLTEYLPKSLPQYLEYVEQLQHRAGHPLWFRGTGKATYQLVPSLYRHPTVTSSADFHELERKLMTRFRQRSFPYQSRDLTDDWEALFFMQHYGAPTRLLDWTENPLTGLHFALMSAPSERGSKRKVKDLHSAAVWVLDPVGWNQAALKHLSYADEPLTPDDEALKGYSPRSISVGKTTRPVALYGAHNSARIVAQQGVFTIFGTNRTPMQRLVWNGAIPVRALSRVVMPPARIQSMRISLLNQGITESTVFPDLEGLARETKRHFGFEV